MTIQETRLFAATSDDRLMILDPAHPGAPWRQIGGAVRNTVGLAGLGEVLFCAADVNQLYARVALPRALPWSLMGQVHNVAGLTAAAGLLFVIQKDGQMWWRDPILHEAKWTSLGIGIEDVAALTTAGGKLFAATRDNELYSREPVTVPSEWRLEGYANNAVALAGTSNELYMVTGGNRLLVCDVSEPGKCKDLGNTRPVKTMTSGVLVPGVPFEEVAEDGEAGLRTGTEG